MFAWIDVAFNYASIVVLLIQKKQVSSLLYEKVVSSLLLESTHDIIILL